MGMREAVNSDFDVAHAVEIRDEGRETINAKMPPGSDRGPMHALPDARNTSQPAACGYEVLHSPVGCHKQGGAQLAVSIHEPLEAPKRATRKVTTGLVLIGG